MIFAIIGGVGSGKSASAVKKIMNYQSKCFVNFGIKAHNSFRLKKEHIIIEDDTGKKKEYRINWDFWNKIRDKHGEFHLFLDEVHNLFHSRMSGSKWNILGTMWIAQIRKILGDSEKTHIFLISQRLSRIDVAFRDLLHGIIYCQKAVYPKQQYITKVWEKGKLKSKVLPAIYVIQYYFTGDACIEQFQDFMFGKGRGYHHRSYFLANPYFQYYDSYEKLGESAYL